MTGHVLCVRRGALGDTLLMIPALRALRLAFPGARLELAGNLDFAVLLQHYGVVDRAFSSEDLRQIAPRWDFVLDERAGFDPRIDASCRRPAAEELLARVRRLAPGAPEVDPTPRLCDARPEPADDAPLVLAPGAGSPSKRRPLAEFASRARAASRPVAVVLGEAERAAEVTVRDAMPRDVELWQGLPILELARRLARAHSFVGNDSGVTHLAAALLVPTTALFVCTDARVWAPAGAHVRVEG